MILGVDCEGITRGRPLALIQVSIEEVILIICIDCDGVEMLYF